MNLSIKNKLVEDKFLTKSELDDLVLYNYSDKCTYEKYWTKETLESRGSIYNSKTGEIVARAFDKFFNLNEHESSKLESLPSCNFTATEKMDGSLGIVFFHNNKWQVSTRGSFYSDQAKFASEYISNFKMEHWDTNYTPLVEIIYPENKIIVNYGERKDLVLLAARHKENGSYLSIDKLKELALQCNFSMPKIYSNSISELVDKSKIISWQDEGYVITYDNGLMVKIKGSDYLRIAKIKNNLGPISIWESIAENRYEEHLQQIPEEIREEAETIGNRLLTDFNSLKEKVESVSSELSLSSVAEEEFGNVARQINTYPQWIRSSLFAKMRNKDYDSILIKILRPDGNVYIDAENYRI